QPLPQSTQALGQRRRATRPVVRLLAAESGSRARRHVVMADGPSAFAHVPDLAYALGARAGARRDRSGARPGDARGARRGVAGSHSRRSTPDPRWIRSADRGAAIEP